MTKGMTNEILLSKDLMDMKAHNNPYVSVLKLYLFVCLLISLLGTSKFVVSFLFSKVRASRLGVCLIYWCGLYMGFYGVTNHRMGDPIPIAGLHCHAIKNKNHNHSINLFDSRIWDSIHD